jgi:2-polyprenyl-3-methyl-5-hydroxy-6-metoxy-1,4-benzoquinol methylase
MKHNAIAIKSHKCRVCGGNTFKKINFNSLLFPTSSHNEDLHDYENYMCATCSVVFQFPEIDDDILVDYYNNEYRKSQFALKLNDKEIDLPIAIPWSGYSFQRFHSFYTILESAKEFYPDAIPTQADAIIDIGAYQGFFLFAANQAWKCKTIGYDYNHKGIEFAKRALGITASKVTKDIYHDVFEEKVRFVTLVHVFEHLREPNKFLKHLKNHILTKDGYLYMEVPNLYGTPLSDPTHFFTYSPDCLRFIIENNGFEVIALSEHGKPRIKSNTWGNTKMNISVLAKFTQKDTATLPNFSCDTRLKELYTEQRNIIKKSISKQLALTGRSILQALYLLLFVLIIEKISYRFAKKLKNIFLNRKSKVI